MGSRHIVGRQLTAVKPNGVTGSTAGNQKNRVSGCPRRPAGRGRQTHSLLPMPLPLRSGQTRCLLRCTSEMLAQAPLPPPARPQNNTGIFMSRLLFPLTFHKTLGVHSGRLRLGRRGAWTCAESYFLPHSISRTKVGGESFHFCESLFICL